MGRKHFVLVHGAQHGAWCWFRTKDLLEKAGHRATAIDLVSAGISTVDADNVASFDQYNQPLCDLLESLDDSEKIILVGHSMGGMNVARASEWYPHKIHVAVYLAASMYTSGVGEADMHAVVFKEHAKDVRFSFGKGVENPPTSCWVSEDVAKRMYYSSCSSEDVQLALMLLRRVPCMSDDGTTFTEKGYYSVPRVYIRTSLDKVLAPRFQDLHISKNPPAEVLTIESDHSPFLSAPKALHQTLLSIAAAYAS